MESCFLRDPTKYVGKQAARRGARRRKGRQVPRARGIVLAGGTLGTNELLARCRFDGTLPALSPRLGELVRTNSEAILVVSVPEGRAEALGKRVAITSSIYPDPHTHIETVTYAGSGSSLLRDTWDRLEPLTGRNAETVEAKGDSLTQLMAMTAKVPFDDRRSLGHTVDVISPTLVRHFLSDIKSDLVSPGAQVADRDLYRYMRISAQVNGFDAPRNVALLFFVNDPEIYFPGARIEVVQFGDGAGGDLIEERLFRGPLSAQIRQALDYLDALSTTMIRKIPRQAEAHRTVAFPYEAMEEALVNAVYHRSYEGVPEPVKVYLYPDRMDIISYPGPAPGIEMRHFQVGAPVPPVPSRNRRIGEFLKELRLAEGRGTGIPLSLIHISEPTSLY